MRVWPFYSENQELLKQWMQSEISQAYWSIPSLNNWYQLKTKDQTWFTEELEDRFIYRHIRPVSIGNRKLYLEVFFSSHSVCLRCNQRYYSSRSEHTVFDWIRGLSTRLLFNHFPPYDPVYYFLFATWLAFYLARGFVQPIEDLALATQRVSEGELGYQVELRGTFR